MLTLRVGRFGGPCPPYGHRGRSLYQPYPEIRGLLLPCIRRDAPVPDEILPVRDRDRDSVTESLLLNAGRLAHLSVLAAPGDCDFPEDVAGETLGFREYLGDRAHAIDRALRSAAAPEC